jgi:hypothetical protein
MALGVYQRVNVLTRHAYGLIDHIVEIAALLHKI